ncbi:MAG TPA: response regulator transcription factor [Gaiellaceae bacterium]|jgi:DNA-binding NarL/FixJ family response regulator|nr:response regulator transcription factor [Gaiellaceae bacterium]
MTVLVVDDDAKFRACMSSLLASGSMDAIEAGDANEAIIAARSHRPDAAILDVALPGVSGYGLCRELRDIYGPDLPVLFVSGSRTDPIDRAAGMLVGGDDYLVKPVDPDELLARLRRLLERARAWSKPSSSHLSDREVQVLQLIAEGLPPNEVARRLVISPKTVSSHVQRILTKLDVHTRAQAVAVAYEAGLIRVSPNEVEAHLAALSL